MSNIKNSKINKALEFDKVKEIWKEMALTNWAKQQIDELEPLMSEGELIVKQKETGEARQILEQAGFPPLVSLNDMELLLDVADRGDLLTGEQLEQIAGALVAVKRLKAYLIRFVGKEMSVPYYEENLEPLSELAEAISTQIRGGQVVDHASKLLKSLRLEIEEMERKMREKADSIMRANKACMSDSFSTLRNGHICIPVKKDCKARIAGGIIDKSATGNTLFVEPEAVATIYEQLEYLKIDEDLEVRRILYELAGMVTEQISAFRQNCRTMEKLDFIFSKGKLSLEWDAVEPEIQRERTMRLVDARHPLMEKGKCVPIQFEMKEGIQGVIITGPNTGGKTVAMKTVALNCIMAQCGLHVCCKEASVCMNSNYLCDIGDGQNMSENLSTFSAHITNVLDILGRVNEDSFVVMDELGSGTDPTEGMGIAVAVLKELKKSGALFLVTTHYPEIKQFAAKEKGILNARMTFDRETLKPMYQLILGEAGESCAFYIAERLGMPGYMLKEASAAAYGKEEAEKQSFDKAKAELAKEYTGRIKYKKEQKTLQKEAIRFNRGDSVMVLPDKKIGIVCETADEKGMLRVQMPFGKIYINHKRIKLHVAAEQLYPEDYDFSIIFDTVEDRKLKHQMERKYVEGAERIIRD